MLESTKNRDEQGQVVYRFLKTENERTGREEAPKILMVDQLWIWLIQRKDHPDVVISSFPQRCSQDKGSGHDLLSFIEDTMRPPITSSSDLVAMILRSCFSLFDPPRESFGSHVQDVLESSIGRVVRIKMSAPTFVLIYTQAGKEVLDVFESSIGRVVRFEIPAFLFVLIC